MIYVTSKNYSDKFFPLPLLVLLLDPGSEIQDSESGMNKNQHPGCRPGSATLVVSYYHSGSWFFLFTRIPSCKCAWLGWSKL
jgi:hypothetical protein